METPSNTISHPHLRHLLADAESTHAEAERLRDTLSDEQLTWRPGPDVWSVADCFEHLRKVDKAYCKRIEPKLEELETSTAAYDSSWFARLFIRFVSPESTFKLKAPKAIRPQGHLGSAPAEAVQRFLDQQAELIDLIRRADGKNINGGKFASPLASILKFSVGEGLTVLVTHERRHLGQALRVTARPDFPNAEA